ncbi:hypothetical protein C6500_11080 [Candidatus Poribacteria bacterium]|nr:MAG: hypothetical protein C6500_11080 [Candidatus Poribacteria bacterium]
MQRNNQLLIAKHKLRKAVPILCLLLCCFALVAFFGCGAVSAIKAPFEMVGFTKGMFAQLEERETFLTESAEKPLTASQEELLTRLLEEKEGLDAVLSGQPYLTYLEEQVGAVHEDYPIYLAAVPTTEQKSATMLALKDLLPPEATDEQIQICTDFYFQCREMTVKEPHIASDSEEMEAFIKVHLVEPLMDTYSSKMSTSDAIEVMKVAVVPTGTAALDTKVFRKIWLKNLEVYGSREGLLRCAISTPDEFALIRSFSEDAAALEEWIRHPPPSEQK